MPTEYGAFEDGNLVYPGRQGPVLSLRLVNWRDGAEDHALLSLLRAHDSATAVALAARLVTNSTHHVGEYGVLDRTRRAAAALRRGHPRAPAAHSRRRDHQISKE